MGGVGLKPSVSNIKKWSLPLYSEVDGPTCQWLLGTLRSRHRIQPQGCLTRNTHRCQISDSQCPRSPGLATLSSQQHSLSEPPTPCPVLMSLLFPVPGRDFVAMRDQRPGPGARLLLPLMHQSQPCPGDSCSSTPTPPPFVLETTRPGAQPTSSLSRKRLALWQMPLSRACCSPESCPQGGPTGLLGAVGTPCPVVI